MKAVTFERTGGPEVLRITEVDTPSPRPGQVLIKTAYAGINFADIGRRSGLYGLGPLPAIPGLEGSGTVEAVGEGVTGTEAGLAVLGYGARGTYAEYFVAREEKVARVPAGVSLEQAAGIGQIFMTSWNALVHKAKLQAGETILVQSAGNGAGIAAVQIAKYIGARVPAGVSLEQAAGIGQIFMTSWNALVHKAKLQAGETILVQSAGNGAGIAAVQIAKYIGARVIGTASNAAKLQAAADSGADEGINYLDTDFEIEVQRLTSGAGVDVVLDGVGGETFTKSIRCLAQNGRILSLGYSGGESTLSVPAFELNRGIVVMGGAAGFTDLPRSEFEKVLALFEDGNFKPVHTDVFPWTEAGEAQRSLEERRAVGKVVLRVV